MVIGGNKMRAECQDVYMIRTPSLSLEYLEKYEKQEKDIYDFISQDKELDQFFRKALLVSSPTLYKNYINKPTDKKKYEKLKESLLKYFLRSIGRPTPYGYFAEVSLGQFGNETELERGDQILDIRVDNNWINQVVQVLEKHEEIQKRLKVRYNTLCYISGDRVKNPYFTNYGKAETGQTIIVENSIRYTKLNDLVKKEAVDFISLLELSNKVKLVYNRLYEKDSNNHKEYEIVEIREFKTYGIQENVINTEKNCNYYMTLGMCSKEIEKEISLEDIYIGIDDNKMYICSKKLGKRLKFVTDNMLNPILNNGISRLLLGISQEYNSYPLARLSWKLWL